MIFAMYFPMLLTREIKYIDREIDREIDIDICWSHNKILEILRVTSQIKIFVSKIQFSKLNFMDLHCSY